MSKNPRGRPRKVEVVGQAIVEMMGERVRKYPSIRAVREGLLARGVEASRGTVHNALRLVASVYREDYEALGGSLAPRLHPRLRHAGGGGIVRHHPRLGWYLDIHQEEVRRLSGALSMVEISLIAATDRNARNAAITAGRITGNRLIRWLARRSPKAQEMLRRLEEDPEGFGGLLRELRPTFGAPSFFEILRTPLGRKIAGLRGVDYTEEDLDDLERAWKHQFELRDSRKDL